MYQQKQHDSNVNGRTINISLRAFRMLFVPNKPESYMASVWISFSFGLDRHRSYEAIQSTTISGKTPSILKWHQNVIYHGQPVKYTCVGGYLIVCCSSFGFNFFTNCEIKPNNHQIKVPMCMFVTQLQYQVSNLI